MVTDIGTPSRVGLGRVRAYLGATTLDEVRAVRDLVGAVTVSGAVGARIITQLYRAGDLYGVDFDPARYVRHRPTTDEVAQPVLPGVPSDTVLSVCGQIAHGLPVARTAGARIRKADVTVLRRELHTEYAHPVSVVLALDASWLGAQNIDNLLRELSAADRDVSICLAHPFDPLAARRHIVGLQHILGWAVASGRRVELLRTDLAGLPAILHGAAAAAVGLTTNTRHVPVPMRPAQRENYLNRQSSALILVRPLLAWIRGHHLAALAPWRGAGITSCRCTQCLSVNGDLLRFATTDAGCSQEVAKDARLHDLHTWTAIARQVLTAADPRAELDVLRIAATCTADELVARYRIALPAMPTWLRTWS